MRDEPGPAGTPDFSELWAHAVDRAVRGYISDGVHPEDALGCLLAASFRFAPSAVTVAASADVLNRRWQAAVSAVQSRVPAVLDVAGWARRPHSRFVSWFRHVYLRWARAKVNPSAWPLRRLGARLRSIDRLVNTLDAEANALGLRSEARVVGQAKHGMHLSGRYPDSAAGRREVARDLAVVLLEAVNAHGSELFTLGPSGEGLGSRQVRDTVGRVTADRQTVSLDAASIDAENRDRPPLELIELADDVDRLHAAIDQLDAEDRFVALRWFAQGTDVADELDVSPARVSQRRAQVLARLKAILKLG